MLNFKEVMGLEGWFGWSEKDIEDCWVVLNEISKFQEHGNLAEIGVYQGKRFVVFADLLKENEIGLAIDIWGDYVEEFTHDGSGFSGDGKKDFSNFINNTKKINPDKDIRTLTQDSRKNDTTEKIKDILKWNENNKIRIFSIDGNHSYDCTLNDLTIASELLSDDGIITIDDYYNWDWPGVKTALDTWLLQNKNYVCFYATHSICLICKRDFYRQIRESIKKGTPAFLVLNTEESVGNIQKANTAGIWDNSEYNPLKNKFCNNPFDNFEVLTNGDVTVCCQAWLPNRIGNLNNNTASEILNSEAAQEIRKSILDGTFKFCNKELCPKIICGLPNSDQITNPAHKQIIENKELTVNSPKVINFVNDPSCNLSCPSCRIKKISLTKGVYYNKIVEWNDKIMDTIPKDEVCYINITGSGDPFGSKAYRELLFDLDGSEYPKLKIQLMTNGVMLTPKYWKKLKKIHNNISDIKISFDAAFPETYNVVRRGGHWQTLLDNVRFLTKEKQSNFKVYLDFVVQYENYFEIPEFIKLGKQLGVNGVCFSRLINWGTFKEEKFKSIDIFDESHEDHSKFLNILKSKIIRDAIEEDFVSMGNIFSFYKKANV